MAKKNLLQLYKDILRIALPPMIGSLGVILFEAIDIYWIGKLGTETVAGVAAACFITWTVYSASRLSIVGCSTLISQFFGAKSKDKIFEVARESFLLTLVIAFSSMIILLLFSETFFTLMGLNKESIKYALEYFTIMAIGLPILFTFTLQEYIFNAYGDTRTSTIVLLISIAINIVLDPCLIFGWWIFPEMGIAGAAVATVISEFIGVLLRLYILRKYDYIPKLVEFLKPSFIHTKRILTIGMPSAASNVTWSLIFPFLTVIITKFGMKPLAAINVAHRFEGFPYFFGLGLSIAMSAMIGKAYGANQRGEIKRIFTHGMILTTIIMAPMAAAFIFIPEFLIGLLNSDPGIIKEGAEYLRIIGYFEIFLGWELAIEGAFNGLGNTKPYMYIRIPLTILRVPLAYVLAFTFNMGVGGVWWACTISTLLKGSIMFMSFYINKRNKELLGHHQTTSPPAL